MLAAPVTYFDSSDANHKAAFATCHRRPRLAFLDHGFHASIKVLRGFYNHWRIGPRMSTSDRMFVLADCRMNSREKPIAPALDVQ